MNSLIFDPHELAKLYKPMFIFSREEMYYPCSAEYIISHSQLYKGDTMLKNFGEVTPQLLSENLGDSLKVHPDSYRGQIETAPIYYYVRSSERFIDIVFFLYFTYNGPFNILGKKVGHHDTDLEHVVVRLDSFTQQLLGIYFSAHGDEGKWVMKKNIKFIQNTPLVYVSKYSHAMYHTEGRQWRAMGFANDKTDFGLAWTSPDVTKVDDNDPIWMKYVGKWARDGIDSLVNKDWWKYQPTKNSNWFTRLIPLDCVINHCMKPVDFDDEITPQTLTYFKQEEAEEPQKQTDEKKENQ